MKHAYEAALGALGSYCGELSSLTGFAFSGDAVRKLAEFAVLLNSYSEANVVGAKDLETVLSEHVMDSLSCLQSETVREGGSFVDIGSGAGLPGIPLAICKPDARFVLIESTGKKVRFQELVVQRMGLRNVTSFNGRVEDLGREAQYRGRYEVAMSRALGSLPVLAEYALPLVHVGGTVVCMKGEVRPEELKSGERAARKLGGGAPEVRRVKRLGGQAEKQRALVEFPKERETPEGYPRRTGIPAKKPLA